MSKPEPIRVKNIWTKNLYKGGQRRRPGEIFWLSDPAKFSRRMVQLDENDKPIVHLGGYDDDGKSLKGLPVFPGEKVSQMTKEEKEEAKEDLEYEQALAKLRREHQMARAPKPTKENVEDAKILSKKDAKTSASNTNVI